MGARRFQNDQASLRALRSCPARSGRRRAAAGPQRPVKDPVTVNHINYGPLWDLAPLAAVLSTHITPLTPS